MRGNIAKRSLIAVFAVIIVLIISISVSTGLNLTKILIEKYTDFALSYVNAAADYIDGDAVKKYYETGQTDEYYDTVQEYLNSTANSSAQEANIKYFYILVPDLSPEGKEYTYIWDAETCDEPAELLEKYPFSEGAKEQSEKFYSKELSQDVQYYVDAEDGTHTLTVSVPMFDSSGDVAAIVAADLSVSGINSTLIKMLVSMLLPVAVIMIVTMAIYYFIVRRRIIEPIVKLQTATEEIVDHIESDEPVEIDIHTNDEIELLADSFVGMTDSLREYISRNAAITAEKERIGAELELATKIQADMLPNIFPAFPERDDFDIYASMTPAKEVGGDFYDFFLVDDTTLAMLVADVSGKGVPAALFMMMSKILIQNQVLSGKTPSQVLEAVNRQICSNNREEMFVTVWLGILDLKTGLLTASNAGHEKPIIKMPGDDFELFSDKHGFVIGGIDSAKYKDYTVQLEFGSKIFIYSDGVVEATRADDALFGTERTVEALNKVKDETPEAILNSVGKAINEFVGDAPQFDDMTMLCFSYIGEPDEIIVNNEVSEISKVLEFVSAKSEKLPLSSKDKNQVEIAIDEIISNIVHYAYGEGKGKATVKLESNDSEMTIIVEDSGVPYNPLEKEDPDTTLSAEERGIGGYGIFIVKKVMDDLEYEYKDGKNILTMRKKFSE